MRKEIEQFVIPLGLIGISFSLEWLRSKMPVIHPFVPTMLFWIGAAMIMLAMVLRIMVWIRHAKEEMSGYE